MATALAVDAIEVKPVSNNDQTLIEFGAGKLKTSRLNTLPEVGIEYLDKSLGFVILTSTKFYLGHLSFLSTALSVNVSQNIHRHGL